MVFKTLIAATCAAALAGSMVYFSTNPGNSGGSIKLDQAASTQVENIQLQANNDKSKVIDRYIKPKKKTDVSEPLTSSDSETEKVKKPKIKAEADKVSKSSTDPAQKRIDVVFRQAERISQPDLRDRAYLDLTDYATNKGLFDQAQKAALRIKQVELRDTARSRIAMGMARYGMADEAFALIEKVEVKELKDVMRLQVIEALLGTDIRR